MMMFRSFMIATLVATGLTAAGAAPLPSATPDIVHTLALSGALRAALYVGTPTSVLSRTDLRGVGYTLGRDLADALGVAYKPKIFDKNDDVLAAVKDAKADVAFTNASPARKAMMDFSQPYLAIELGYLAGPKTSVAAIGDVDKTGVKVAVTTKSSSDAYLSSHLKAATIVREPDFKDGLRQLAASEVDVYATNKASLFEMADKLPGSHVLAGNWGTEKHGIAIPKGRETAIAYLKSFVASEIESGKTAEAIKLSGLRGVTSVDAEP